MSYARFGWEGSDVYVYPHVSGGIECCACPMDEGRINLTPLQMLRHLKRHRIHGDQVPDSTFRSVFRDRWDTG